MDDYTSEFGPERLETDRKPGLHFLTSRVTVVSFKARSQDHMTLTASDSEKALLRAVYEELGDIKQSRANLVSYNGAQFDNWMLFWRGLRYGLRFDKVLYIDGLKLQNNDLFQALGGKWAPMKATLDELAWYFGLPRKTTSGEDCLSMALCGDYAGISDHCEFDLVLLENLDKIIRM